MAAKFPSTSQTSSKASSPAPVPGKGTKKPKLFTCVTFNVGSSQSYRDARAKRGGSGRPSTPDADHEHTYTEVHGRAEYDARMNDVEKHVVMKAILKNSNLSEVDLFFIQERKGENHMRRILQDLSPSNDFVQFGLNPRCTQIRCTHKSNCTQIVYNYNVFELTECPQFRDFIETSGISKERFTVCILQKKDTEFKFIAISFHDHKRDVKKIGILLEAIRKVISEPKYSKFGLANHCFIIGGDFNKIFGGPAETIAPERNVCEFFENLNLRGFENTVVPEQTCYRRPSSVDAFIYSKTDGQIDSFTLKKVTELDNFGLDSDYTSPDEGKPPGHYFDHFPVKADVFLNRK